jgi:hypothetical protein
MIGRTLTGAFDTLTLPPSLALRLTPTHATLVGQKAAAAASFLQPWRLSF